MKSCATFRRHPYGQVVPPVNDDRPTQAIVPYGLFAGGLWTGHPIGLFIVIGMLVIALIGIPEWRWFFSASVLAGTVVAYFLWQHHQQR